MLPAPDVISDFIAEKSNFPLPSVSAGRLDSDIIESLFPEVRFNPDIEMSELELSAAVSRDDGSKGSVPGAAADIRESELAVIGSREWDAEEIRLVEEDAGVIRGVDLARLRRADDDDDDGIGLPATSVALASSISRSLSSLR